MSNSSHILPEHDIRPYSVPQLAERWGCSDSMIRKLINLGELKCFRIGALIRIAAAEVERFETTPVPVQQTATTSSVPVAGDRKVIGRKPRKRSPIVRS
ncbi:helix-turn-helix domain-containing protein [Sphingopyxis granuli]|uniref:helix-turn-helix domain-containing protein n=1 Tax=Sphingopyxis granuli TaxID=267128 RepID=UPI001BAED558|nr:helix-turn-helix domain-containing protein [Sphingopyxis granuli]QUM70831.1 helix-turn-helix domain-containing protein [Sphingopyxis granuli]